MERIINPSYSLTTELFEDGRSAVAIELRDEAGRGAVELVFTEDSAMHLAVEMTKLAGHFLNVLKSHSYDEAMEILGIQDAFELTTEALEGLENDTD